jgi:hypothetical protein
MPVKKTTKKRSLIDKPEKFWKATALILFGVVILSRLFNIRIEPKFKTSSLFLQNLFSFQDNDSKSGGKVDVSQLQNIVIPAEGVPLPIIWGDLGKRMVADGVIDEQKLKQLFQNGLQANEEKMLSGEFNNQVVLNQQNSRFLLDMLWAFGLANKNEILENGEMTDEKYGGDASKFASTGGWSLSSGPAINHYSKHDYVILTSEQQELVDQVSQGIYRPCCGNSTHFPDCNHGMAMLGLLELMAANGVSEQEMYDVALKVNSLWFPQTYIELATYFKEQGQEWNEVDPKIALSADYSSAQGYQATRQKIVSLPKPQQGGGGCGV